MTDHASNDHAACKAQDQAWQQNLSAMIEKAKPHGWIDEARKAIKAHIEWQE